MARTVNGDWVWLAYSVSRCWFGFYLPFSMSQRKLVEVEVVMEMMEEVAGRRVTFTKLVVNKIGAVLKLMQEHLERAGLSNDLEVSV